MDPRVREDDDFGGARSLDSRFRVLCYPVIPAHAGTHFDFRSFAYSFSPRLMISFMISEVPANIRWIRALAYMRQIGYSHM